MRKFALIAHTSGHPEDLTTAELERAIKVALRKVYIIREGRSPIPASVQVHTIKFEKEKKS